MTAAEFYTTQFYAWEQRCRGWYVSPVPICLEPPFIPFFRHGYHQAYIDDGKRPSIISSIIDALKGKTFPIPKPQEMLEYDTIEPFVYEQAFDLCALQVVFGAHRRITPERMKALLIMLSSLNQPLSFEIIGTEDNILVQFVCDVLALPILEMYISAYFPDCTVLRNDDFLDTIIVKDQYIHLVDFGLIEECVRPISSAKNFSFDPLLAVIAVLDRLEAGQQAGLQILFEPALNPWSESMIRSVTLHDSTSFFADAPEAPKLAQEKTQSPLYAVTIRAFAQADTPEASTRILTTLANGIIHPSKGAYNSLQALPHGGYDFETRQIDIYRRQSHRLGMLLNVDELITFLHFPSEHIVSKKLFVATRKTKQVPTIAKWKECILGENIHAGVTELVTVGIEERVKHMHIIGATGTGKSTLVATLVLQDIEAGRGAIVFDPHGDLVDDIIAHVPDDRLFDVVLIDPSDTEYPIGLNILQAKTDIEKEVLSSDLVAIFKKYATSWGDQMTTVLGNAILALLESDSGGSLSDLRRFLIEKDFRNALLKRVSDPSVQYYWHHEYPLLKTNSIGPILTRLDTFLRPKSIRNMVVQKKGLDFADLIASNKIVLLKLSQGMIGVENSFLLGSLFLSKIHQAILQRQQQSDRQPFFIYLDEFQNFITPSIKEMISGVRKYNVGLILSHQDLQQLQREDGELLNSVLGNINTRIVFRVGEPDAKKLQDGFSGFDHTDLQNLGRGEAVVRIEQPKYDCSLDTFPLSEGDENTMRLVTDHTRTEYAAKKEDVERELYASFNMPEEPKPAERKKAPASPPFPTTHDPVPESEPEPEEEIVEPTKTSTHRYLQTLIKNMAQSKGYKATIEAQTPDGEGSVDVLLTKDNTTIACEISVTTTPEWEVHNIRKCVSAGYNQIVMCGTEEKHLIAIGKAASAQFTLSELSRIHFFTPEELFQYLDAENPVVIEPEETVIKGYRVNVSYNGGPKDEAIKKRESVKQVVANALKRLKKK